MYDMLIIENKVLVLFNTNVIKVYSLKENTLKLLSEECVTFEGGSVTEALLEKLDGFLDTLEKSVGTVNNERIRLYAIGIFQKFNSTDQTKLIIHTFVDYGLYFNIIQPDLEQFYLETSISIYGSKNIMEGLIHQEFRKVVVCGSFQQHLDEIGDIMTVLQKYNIEVLSPWTTKVVPETLGTDFILLEGQEPLKNKRDAWKHKYIHMNKFRQSDAIIVCNPDGLIGKGTMFEFGFMVALSKRIIFTERPKDLTLPFPYEIGLNFK